MFKGHSCVIKMDSLEHQIKKILSVSPKALLKNNDTIFSDFDTPFPFHVGALHKKKVLNQTLGIEVVTKTC